MRHLFRKSRLLKLFLVLSTLFSALVFLGGRWLDLEIRLFRFRRNYTQATVPLEFSFPLKITFWTLWFKKTRFTQSFNSENCPFPDDIPEKPPSTTSLWCRYSHDKSQVKDSVFIGFHARDTDTSDLPARYPGQQWVLLSQESPAYDFYHSKNTFITDYSSLRLFDISMSYRLDSDVPIPYTDTNHLDKILFQNIDIPSFDQRNSISNGQAAILWVASNCHAVNERHEYIKELAKIIPIDSFGSCLQNGNYPTLDSSKPSEPIPLIDLMKKYKFYLAIENSNCKDYVSEKIFNVFEAGAIPIVSGPPGVNGSGYVNFVPVPESAIYLDDFPHPSDLAVYLRRIETDENLWNERHSYRKDRTMTNEFKSTWSSQHLDWGFCGLCRRAARERWADILDVRENGVLTRIKGSSLRPDFSCKPPGSLKYT